MRRAIFLTIASLTTLLALPPVHVDAICTPPPSPTSAAGLRVIRQAAFIVWGTIDGSTVPTDAHAAHSFFLDVRGYFRGAGPARIEVSDYSDGDIPTQALVPGAASDASTEFITHFGGQDAVVFAARDRAPFAREFSTNICSYTAYGDAETADILPVLRRVIGAPQPATLPQTGPASVAAMTLAAAALVAAGGAMRFRGRRPKSLVFTPPAR